MSSGRVRVRQHVNPLGVQYQIPVQSPDWDKLYEDPTQPLHLDIGCGRGRFMLQFAQQEPKWNFLGLEIREPLVVQANDYRDEMGLRNCHCLFCNVNTSLRSLLSSLPRGVLQRVTIQFPDPWFKRRHQKRRVVQSLLVEDLASFLQSKGLVFLQSDVEEVVGKMVQQFACHPSFERLGGDRWLPESPFPVQTERENVTLEKGEPIFRALFQRI